MMENKEAIIEEAEESVLHTYNRYQVVLDMETGSISMIRTGKNISTLRQALPCRLWATIIRATMRPEGSDRQADAYVESLL